MASEQLEGIDISVWGGVVDQATWRKLYAAGQRVAVVGSAHPRPNPYAQNNLLAARSAGMAIATYAALYPGVTGEATIDTAKAQCGTAWDYLSFVAVDCEVDGITQEQISKAVIRVKSYGKRPVLYTAYWWWHDHFQNSHAFATLPLWNAYYDNDPDYDFQKAPYGGWTIDSVIGEQYGNTQLLEGVSVDRNSFRRDFIEEMAEPDLEDDLNPACWVRDTVTFKSYIIVGGKKRHVESAAQEAAYLKAGYIKLPDVQMTTAELSTIPDAQ